MLKDLGLDPCWDNHDFKDQVEADFRHSLKLLQPCGALANTSTGRSLRAD